MQFERQQVIKISDRGRGGRSKHFVKSYLNLHKSVDEVIQAYSKIITIKLSLELFPPNVSLSPI